MLLRGAPRWRPALQWHSKDIRSYIHSYPLMHTPKSKTKPSTHQTRRLRLVVLFPYNLVATRHRSPLSFTRPLPVQCACGRQPGTFAFTSQDCSTSEVFWPRTVLTKTICRCIQQILQHRPTTMPFLKFPTIALSCLASAAPQADS